MRLIFSYFGLFRCCCLFDSLKAFNADDKPLISHQQKDHHNSLKHLDSPFRIIYYSNEYRSYYASSHTQKKITNDYDDAFKKKKSFFFSFSSSALRMKSPMQHLCLFLCIILNNKYNRHFLCE